MKKLLLTFAFILSIFFAFVSFASCVKEVESETVPVSETASDSTETDDSDSGSEPEEPPVEEECDGVHKYYQGATGKYYEIPADEIYSKAELQTYFGNDLGGLTFFGNEVIDCLHNGHAMFICDRCGEPVLIEISGEHSYEYKEELSSISATEVNRVYVCSICDDHQSAAISDFSKYTVNSNCSLKGGVYVSFKYTFGSEVKVPVSDVKVEEFDFDNNVHKYASKKVLLDNTYLISELKGIFGQGLDGLIILDNEYDCVTAGSAIFDCADCQNTYQINILKDHDYVYSEEDSNLTYNYDEETGEYSNSNDFGVNFRCTMCGDIQPATVDLYSIRSINSSCSVIGGVYLDYKYAFDGKTYSKTKIIAEDSAINLSIHIFDGEEINVSETYEEYELAEFFGDDFEGLTFLANDRDCITLGYAMFTCSACNGDVALHVYGNHEYEFNEEGSSFDDGDVRLLFVCKVCEENYEIPVTDYEYYDVPATCDETGGKYIRYNYELLGQPHTDSALVELYEIDPHVHKVNGVLIDDNELIEISQLKAAFGENLDGLTVLKEYTDCTEEGSGLATFTCANCNVAILLKTRDDHTYVLDEEGSQYGEQLVVLHFVCSVCGDEKIVQVVPIVTHHHSAVLSDDGLEYIIHYNVLIEYTYTLEGKRYTDSKTWEEQPLVFNEHEHMGEIVDQTIEYTYDELVAIFGPDLIGIKNFENDPNYVTFICDECGMQILLKLVVSH